MKDSVLPMVALFVGAILLRALWGLGRLFLSNPESARGWFVRAALVWVVARMLGLA